jgi:putative transposase
MAFSAIKIKLYPNKHQTLSLRQNCGCRRFIWNHFLNRNIEEYKNNHRKLTFEEICKELTALKQVYPWLNDADSQSLQQTLRDLGKAYDNFFKKRAKFPRFKAKFRSKESFRIPQRMFINPITRSIKIPKHGEMPFRCDVNRWRGVKDVRSITVSVEGNLFYASCLIEVVDFNPISHRFSSCGVDVGVKRPLTVVYGSNNKPWHVNTAVFGVKFSEELRKKELRRVHYQRRLARRQKGSNNREKSKHQVTRAYQKERFYRRNWIEQTSHALSTNFKSIKFEDLKISNMTRSAKGTLQNPCKSVAAKSGLNREMLRLGLSGLITRTEQKSMINGGQVTYINPRYTSQTCSCCGVIDKRSRRSQSEFRCVSCGHKVNADKNAALNILRA